MSNKQSFFITATISKKIGIGVPAGVLLAIVFSVLYAYGLMDRLDFVSAEWRRRVFSGYKTSADSTVISTKSSGNIVYLTLNETSIEEAYKYNGIRWPWPRDAYAIVLDYVRQGGAKAIVFDLFMDTPRSQDEGFIATIANTPQTVIAGLFLRRQPEQDKSEPTINETVPKFSLDVKTDGSVSIEKALKPVVFPAETIAGPLHYVGDAFFFDEKSGINLTRQNNLLVEYDGRYYPSLALAAVMASMNTRVLEIKDRRFIIGEGTEQKVIPVDRNGKMWVNFYGPASSYETYPIYNVITSSLAEQAYLIGDTAAKDNIHINKNVFKDKIVIVMATAYGLMDLRPNPFNKNDPGGHFHGSTIDTILNNDYIRDYYSLAVIIPVLLLLGILGMMIGVLMNPKLSVITTLLIAATVFILAIALYTGNHLVEMTTSLTVLILSYFGGLGLHLAFERKQKSFIKGAFSQFLAPAVIQKLIKDPNRLTRGGEEKTLSVFFSDLQGFTSMSEMLTPAKLVEILNYYLTEMADNIVIDHDGYVDKYEGDAIMAFWGAPLDEAEHAKKACFAALDNQKKLKGIQGFFKSQGLHAGLTVRIGINTGRAVVGMMGSEKKLNYTVIGDSVNLASRLEGANKVYGTKIMISDYTYQEAKEFIEVRELDLLRVKGKNEPVKVYELLARKNELDETMKKLVAVYHKGLAHYKAREWDLAISAFDEALTYDKFDGPSQLYITRCKEFKKNPPPDYWDGIFIMKTK